ncbi:MAG: hypothetical protein OHK0022_06560 [Roseiflexaceae bacterium]
MQKVQQFLSQFNSQRTSFKMRTTGQRIEIHHNENQTLKGLLSGNKQKKRKQYIDLSYHDTVNYIDEEYGQFYDQASGAGLNPVEIMTAYDMLISQQTSTVGANSIETSTISPLTTMTPNLMNLYHDSHYKKELVNEDETSSTRRYESDYLGQVERNMPISIWRPFVLPDRSSQEERSLVNAIGGTLDANVPTSGKTIGQGKVYSAIYKHFQRTMELINQMLDTEHSDQIGTGNTAFQNRTRLHNKYLESSFLTGLYENEQSNFSDQDSGFSDVESLVRSIDTLSILISASLDNVPEDPNQDFDILIDLEEMLRESKTFVKNFELIGSILGMMVKKEKRLILNLQMLGKSHQTKEHLENLYRLSRVEAKINAQIDRLWAEIGKLLNRSKEQKQINKELRDLY